MEVQQPKNGYLYQLQSGAAFVGVKLVGAEAAAASNMPRMFSQAFQAKKEFSSQDYYKLQDTQGQTTLHNQSTSAPHEESSSKAVVRDASPPPPIMINQQSQSNIEEVQGPASQLSQMSGLSKGSRRSSEAPADSRSMS